MAKFRNVSPLGALDVPAVGIVESGAEFDVPADLVANFSGQTGNFEPVDAAARAAQVTAVQATKEAGTDPGPDGKTAVPAVNAVSTEGAGQ